MKLQLLMFFAAALTAQVHFRAEDVAISVDGKPFAVFQYGVEANKPFLSPLRSASGKTVTRLFPMQVVPGESRDHLHHRGLWFSYDDVNGVKFWENDPSYKRGKIGKIVVKSVKWKDGAAGTLTALMDWQDPDGKSLLSESREMTFSGDAKLRTVDTKITLTAATDVSLGDTKEGAFAIRLAEAFTEKRGMKMTDSEGRAGMVNIWGKRAKWVDYQADLDGEKLGVAIMDHPGNPHFPTYWHARDYGMFSLNPFGQKSFDPSAAENITKLSKGQKLAFTWRLVIHPAEMSVADLYAQFTEKK